MNFFILLWNGIANNLTEPKHLRKFDQIVSDIKSAIITIAICLVLWYCVTHSPLNQDTYNQHAVKYNSIINTIIDSIKHDWKR